MQEPPHTTEALLEALKAANDAGIKGPLVDNLAKMIGYRREVGRHSWPTPRW